MNVAVEDFVLERRAKAELAGRLTRPVTEDVEKALENERKKRMLGTIPEYIGASSFL